MLGKEKIHNKNIKNNGFLFNFDSPQIEVNRFLSIYQFTVFIWPRAYLEINLKVLNKKFESFH